MSYAHLLGDVDIFADLDQSRLECISSICSECRYDTGTIIFEGNTQSDGLYVILSGEVAILVDPDILPSDSNSQQIPGPLTISKLRLGQCFGEIALVDEGVRSASARAEVDETRLLLIRRGDLLRLCQEDFELGFLLMRNLAADLALKIRQTDLRLRQRLLWKS